MAGVDTEDRVAVAEGDLVPMGVQEEDHPVSRTVGMTVKSFASPDTKEATPKSSRGGEIRNPNDKLITCLTFNQWLTLFSRLKNFGLKIDVLFPNPDIPLPKILGNIASRGVLFAIVVTPLNEDHKSMTVNILQVNSNVVLCV